MRGPAFQGEAREHDDPDKGRQTVVSRWVVVCGVIAYCVVAWGAVFHLGGEATDWLAGVFNADGAQTADVENLPGGS